MRITSIGLMWFRGAADAVSLELDCRSAVIYGVNGSGKSSFVDGLEYALNGGRIGHLAHEYSGKHQEKAVPNTHTPDDRQTALSIRFADASELKIEIRKDGSFTKSGGEGTALDTWDYRRTVLRQDEVAAFIHDTKGGKYSALLPLLGLHRPEVGAENLRQLAKAVEKEAKLSETRISIRQVEKKRRATFGSDNNEQILTKIEGLHAAYCLGKASTRNALARCEELKAALDARIAESSADQRRYVVLQDAAALDVKGDVDRVRASSVELAGATESLIVEKLEVLQSTRKFVEHLGDEEEEVKCPACGRSVRVEVFQAHVENERQRLHQVRETFEDWKAALGTLCDTVKSLKSSLGKTDVRSWRDELAKGLLADDLAYLNGINTEELRVSCGEEELSAIEDKLLPLIEAAAWASRDAPPDPKQLSSEKCAAEVGSEVIRAETQAAELARAEALLSFISSLERGMRDEIRLCSRKAIEEISADIQAMWSILHRGEAIEDVRLYLPKGTDKAIDIALKFHGIEQDSPRLTLSEGYRNSLGLCIFLAMAKREVDKDRPIFLDDVVVSLDRNHRGMIVELLDKEFTGRQVVVLTHDREWYTELRHQLDRKNWACKALLPY